MKTIRIKLKTIAMFFAALILLQGCVVYHKTPVNLEQAANAKQKTKINTIADETVKFKSIEYEDGQFFGLKKENGKIVKVPLDTNEVYKLYLQNKNKSTWATVLLIATPIVAFGILAIIAVQNMSLGYGW